MPVRRRAAWRVLLAAAAPFILAGCLLLPPETPPCEFKYIRVDTDFEGGAIAACRRGLDGSIRLTIRPEAPPTNNSPWYAFRVSSDRPRDLVIRLEVEDGRFRYWPKLSVDGESWVRMPEDRALAESRESRFRFTLPMGEETIWIAAQELLTTDDYDLWIEDWAAATWVTRETIGTSRDGQPIELLSAGQGPDTVVLLGRQHPPEVTGAIAMKSFLDVVLGASRLAQDFRERYRILAVPLVNPDGVDRGHWRFGTGGLDLNRDWGGFTEPETSALVARIDDEVAAGAAVRLMLDFHSTFDDKFYTQVAADEAQPIGFDTSWFDRVRSRLPDYEFEHDPRPPSGQANTKNYFFERFGVHAMTYELGDDTDRPTIERVTPVFAEEMMRELLSRERVTP